MKRVYKGIHKISDSHRTVPPLQNVTTIVSEMLCEEEKLTIKYSAQKQPPCFSGTLLNKLKIYQGQGLVKFFVTSHIFMVRSC
jgi:hypothetical protein